MNYYFDLECPHHMEQICYFFCYTCRTPYCGHCSFSDKHLKSKGHKVADIKEEVENYFLFSEHFLEDLIKMKSERELIHNKIKISNDLQRKRLSESKEKEIMKINEYFKTIEEQINECDKLNLDNSKTFSDEIGKNISKLTQLRQMGNRTNEQEIISQFGKYYKVFSNNLLKNPPFSKCEITKLNEIEILNNPISIEIKNFEYKEECMYL